MEHSLETETKCEALVIHFCFKLEEKFIQAPFGPGK